MHRLHHRNKKGSDLRMIKQNKLSSVLLSFLFSTTLVAEPFLTIHDLTKQAPCVDLLFLSPERIQAEQLCFAARKKRFSFFKKSALVVGGALGSMALYRYFNPDQKAVNQELNDKDKERLDAEFKLAYLKQGHPSFGQQCKNIVESAIALPLVCFIINGALSWGHNDALPRLMQYAGSTAYDCDSSSMHFTQAYKNFMLIVQKIQSAQMSAPQEASYKQALFCAHNALILYAENLIARLLVEASGIKPEHQAFKQEVVESVKSTLLTMQSLSEALVRNYRGLAAELLYEISSAHEVLSAQQKRMYLYV